MHKKNIKKEHVPQVGFKARTSTCEWGLAVDSSDWAVKTYLALLKFNYTVTWRHFEY